MKMTACTEILKKEFPSINGELQKYVEGIRIWITFIVHLPLFSICKIDKSSFSDVLESGADEFEDAEEIYEAIGAILHELAEEKSENDIR